MGQEAKCFCEGSCPQCRIGEVEDHKCDFCKATFCPLCHGTIDKGCLKESNILPCICMREKVGIE
jgi:hypothetical protein